MDLVRVELVALALGLGVLSLGVATAIGARTPAVARGRRATGLRPLVPWVGGLLVVLLVVRGAFAGAVVVGVATVLHALLTRARTFLDGR